MSTTVQSLEYEIAGLLDNQCGLYQHAYALLEPASADHSETVDLNLVLGQLNGLMDQAAQNEQQLRLRWSAWENGHFGKSTLLHERWVGTEAELKRLIERVELITQRAQSTRDAMLPHLGSGQTHHQMRAAYGRME